MMLLRRMMLALGAVAIVVAVTLAIAVKGWEFASWVSGIVGALSIAGSLVIRAANFGDRKIGGDEIELRNVKAGKKAVGKDGVSDSENDRIMLDGVEAGEDVYGKRTKPTTEH